jgi:probable HAF family extracellular repeat protein
MAAILFTSPESVQAAATFTPLGDLPGGAFSSGAYGISADGSVVVGQSESANGFEAFRWTDEGGLVGLGDLPGGAFESFASAVTPDGSVVVGYGSNATEYEPFRWTASGGMVGLGSPPGGDSFNVAADVSADGSLIVGVDDNKAFHWTATAGMVRLPSGLEANSVSDDGTVIVGRSVRGAFRWTAENGMLDLANLPGAFFSAATAVSSDGAIVVGHSVFPANPTFKTEAFRWNAKGGMVGLGDLAGGRFVSHANAVSADGSVVVGQSEVALPNTSEAFYWTDTLGMVNLRNLLIGQGASNLAGWRLEFAFGVSADGRTIVGQGINPSGQFEGWVARLDAGPTLVGDFNKDGAVDAADYIVWRKGLGTTYTQDDYDAWRANFGRMASSGGAIYPLDAPAPRLSAAIPEPAVWVLVATCAICLLIHCTRYTNRPTAKGNRGTAILRGQPGDRATGGQPSSAPNSITGTQILWGKEGSGTMGTGRWGDGTMGTTIRAWSVTQAAYRQTSDT